MQVPKRSKGRSPIEGVSHPFSVKIFAEDYDSIDRFASNSGIPKSILFRLVVREALKTGILSKVASLRK
jgi:hypothetical protein